MLPDAGRGLVTVSYIPRRTAWSSGHFWVRVKSAAVSPPLMVGAPPCILPCCTPRASRQKTHLPGQCMHAIPTVLRADMTRAGVAGDGAAAEKKPLMAAKLRPFRWPQAFTSPAASMWFAPRKGPVRQRSATGPGIFPKAMLRPDGLQAPRRPSGPPPPPFRQEPASLRGRTCTRLPRNALHPAK